MPAQTFDMGVLQISSEDILVFGGFDGGAKKEAYKYQVTGKSVVKNDGSAVNADGEFRQINSLGQEDFFEQNGVFIENPKDDGKSLIFNGHSHIHLFNKETQLFSVLPLH